MGILEGEDAKYRPKYRIVESTHSQNTEKKKKKIRVNVNIILIIKNNSIYPAFKLLIFLVKSYHKSTKRFTF